VMRGYTRVDAVSAELSARVPDRPDASPRRV
jgi:hypothetical protein